MNDDISSLKNLGPKTSQWLRDVGIHTISSLRSIGSVEAFMRLKHGGMRPTLVALWALEMGLQGRHWADITNDEKRRLKAELALTDPTYREQRR